jgi:hypothetical protein
MSGQNARIQSVTPNGPAVGFSKRYPTQFRPKQNPLSEDNLIEVGKGGYGALFAVRVQILLSITRVAVQV